MPLLALLGVAAGGAAGAGAGAAGAAGATSGVGASTAASLASTAAGAAGSGSAALPVQTAMTTAAQGGGQGASAVGQSMGQAGGIAAQSPMASLPGGNMMGAGQLFGGMEDAPSMQPAGQQLTSPQPELFQNLVQAQQLQGPTRSGVPLSTATQANVLGNTTDFNAKPPGFFGNMVKGGTGQGGTGFGALLGAALTNAKPGGQGVPQVDGSFMNQPMSSPQQDMAIQRSVDPQSMLLAMLQRQVG